MINRLTHCCANINHIMPIINPSDSPFHTPPPKKVDLSVPNSLRPAAAHHGAGLAEEALGSPVIEKGVRNPASYEGCKK